MNAIEYIKSELTECAKYTLTEDDKKLLESIGVEEFIYKKLTSKKFRKWRVDELSEKQVRKAISLAVTKGEPIQFRYPFGGYKLWHMPSAPEVDWAEFFAISYYLRYVAPIAAAYKPGVEWLFSSDDLIIERMDNVAKADTNAYFESFKELLELFKPYLPKNLSIDIVRIADMYSDKAVMEEELSENIDKTKLLYEKELPADKKEKMYTTSSLNIKWNGAKDLTSLSEEEKENIVKMGPVFHDAYCALSKRREFNRGEDKIVIFTTPIPNAIAVGTTKSSVTKYWTGFGVLEEEAGVFKSRVLSPSQLEKNSVDFELVKNVIGSGLKNLQDLRVYKSLNIGQ